MTEDRSHRSGTWKKILFLIAILLSLQFFAKPSTASTEKVTFYAQGCHICIIDYFRELTSSLSKIGINDVQVVDNEATVTSAETQLYQKLNVPDDMRGKCVVSVDDRFLFINYVSVDIVSDFLANHSRQYNSIVIYQDSLYEKYRILFEDGNLVECDDKTSAFETIGNTKITLPFLTVIPLIIVSGLIDSINPCAFAVMFFFLAFLYVARRDSSEDVRPKVRLVGTVYIIGVYISYLLIGLAVIDVFMITPFPNLIKTIVAALVVFLGAVNVKDYFWPGKWLSLKIPKSQWRTIAGWMHKFTIPSAFIVGLLVSVVEFPCTGGVYLGILGLLASSATFMQGLTYLMIYNVMFVLPLIIILIVSSNKRVVEKMRAWNISQEKPMRLISGLVMVLMGVYLLLSAF